MMDPSPAQHRLPPPSAFFPDERIRAAEWVATTPDRLRGPSQFDHQGPNLAQMLPRGVVAYDRQGAVSAEHATRGLPLREPESYGAPSPAPHPDRRLEFSDIGPERGFPTSSRYGAHPSPSHWTHHPHMAQHPALGAHWPHPAPPPAFQQHSDAYDYSRKKRLRNSRSCAECQRRKTRCDAVGTFAADAADGKTYPMGSPSDRNSEGDMIVLQPCTNCARSGVTCQYSKKPAKRGPSKGYIKDLESRLIDLENQTLRQESEEDYPESEDKEWRRESRGHDTDSQHSLPEEGLTTGKRPMRPWEFQDSHPIKREKRLDAQETRASLERDSVDVAEVMVSLSNSPPVNVSTSVSSETRFPGEDSPSCTVDVVKAENPQPEATEEAKSGPELPRSSQASKVRQAFAYSEMNGTFGICPFDGGQAVSTAGMDDRLVVRAMQLLLEPASPSSAPLASEAVSRMTTPASVNGAETGVRSVIHGKARGNHFGSSHPKGHNARLGHLQGLCMAGVRFNGADGFLSSSNSAMSAIAAARKVRNALSCLEGEALLLCYLDGLRHGNPDNSALAAACSKVSMCHGQEADAPTSRRNCALFAVDRWHSTFFNTSHALTGRALPSEETLYRQMEEYAQDASGCLNGAPAEVIRAALMFNSLQDIAESHGGYKNVSGSQCESIIHSAGSLDGSGSPGSSEHRQSADSLDDISHQGEQTNAQQELHGNLYTLAALKTTLRGTFQLFFHLQTLPLSTDLTPKALRTTLATVEECILVGPSRTPLNPQTLLMRSFVGPFVFGLASTAISWLARAIAVVAKRSHRAITTGQDVQREKIDEELPQLAYLRVKLQDYARMLGQLSVYAAGTGQKVQPLWLRVAAYNHTNVSYLSLLTDILSPSTSPSSASTLDTDSPLGDSMSSLCKEADGRAALIQEMGPLGLVLASTTAKEAWSLISDD